MNRKKKLLKIISWDILLLITKIICLDFIMTQAWLQISFIIECDASHGTYWYYWNILCTFEEYELLINIILRFDTRSESKKAISV